VKVADGPSALLGSLATVHTQILGKCANLKSPDIHVAFGIDSKYLPALGACIHSIIRNNADVQIQFHVIAASLPHGDIEQLAAFAEQHSLALQLHILGRERLANIPEPKFRRFSSAIYNRLWICEILDGVASHVLYLDTDIICLGNMMEITRTRLDGKIVAAVAEIAQNELKSNINLVTDEPYFNSGVLYIDVEKWNLSHVTQHVIERLIDNDGTYAYPDQDALNKVLMGNIAFIDKRWNLFYSHFKPAGDTVFLHYSNEKPWQVWSSNFGETHFASNIAGTPWADYADRTPVSRNQRLRHARRLLGRWKMVGGLYWYARALCTPKSVKSAS
jgi:lipopolysaccharide biosynthesis glycosyltransferase